MMMIVQLSVLALVALSCLGNVEGFHKCYECIEADKALLTAAGIKSDGETCKYKALELKWSHCTEGKEYCLKAKGYVTGGKKVEQRSCVGKEFKALMGDKMGCKYARDVEGFKFAIGAEGLAMEGGKICICDTNKCNTGTHPHPYPIYSFLIVGILLVFFGF